MASHFAAAAEQLLGLSVPADRLTFVQMSLRAVVVFATTLVTVRVSHRRFLGQLSTFDAVVGFILASTLARAVNGSAAFVPTLGCGFVIIGLHRGLTALAFRFPSFGNLIKGRPDVLGERGRLYQDRLRAHGVSEEDVLEQARLNAGVGDISGIGVATLERNGQVSVVRNPERT